MEIPINKSILQSLEGGESRIEYILDWCTGYIHRDQVFRVLSFSNEISSLIKNTSIVDVDDSTVQQIILKYKVPSEQLHLCINLLLIVGTLLGEGE